MKPITFRAAGCLHHLLQTDLRLGLAPDVFFQRAPRFRVRTIDSHQIGCRDRGVPQPAKARISRSAWRLAHATETARSVEERLTAARSYGSRCSSTCPYPLDEVIAQQRAVPTNAPAWGIGSYGVAVCLTLISWSDFGMSDDSLVDTGLRLYAYENHECVDLSATMPSEA